MAPKVLLVDDEDSILSAAKRLFRGKAFEIHTTHSPSEALKKLKENSFSVVISDYRMPEMTGVDLLEQVKSIQPQATRMMLTGFLEMPIIQEAVNRSQVFRFISKPWDDNDLILGVDAALAHHIRKIEREKYLSEISSQNIRLEVLTRNLESEVMARTRGIEESTIQAQEKQRLVREITGFVKSLSHAQNFREFAEVIFQELEKFRFIESSALGFYQGGSEGQLIWQDGRTMVESRLGPSESLPRDISFFNSNDPGISWLAKRMGRKLKGILSFPFLDAALLVEISASNLEQTQIMDRLKDRMQPVGVVLDRIMLHNQIEKARKQWEATFNSFNDPIAVVDSHFNLVRNNKKFLKIQSEICHKAFDDSEFVCPGCPVPKAINFQESTTDLVRLKDFRTFRVHSYPIRIQKDSSPTVETVVNYYTDMSRERELYMQLVQSEKLAAVGLLAGNLAHELNNPLTGIRSLAQVLQLEVDSQSSLYQDLSEVEKASKRCQNIIENLLNYSNPVTAQADVSANEVIEATLPLLKTALRMQSVHTQFADGLPLVRMPFSQLQQVIFNLINNACQAMGESGTLTIKTELRGTWVCVSIADTGPGIPQELRKRIFEFFFTTKVAGQGTGLGLSVSKNMIERYGGRLAVDSEVGKGSTFIISLPVAQK